MDGYVAGIGLSALVVGAVLGAVGMALGAAGGLASEYQRGYADGYDAGLEAEWTPDPMARLVARVFAEETSRRERTDVPALWRESLQ